MIVDSLIVALLGVLGAWLWWLDHATDLDAHRLHERIIALERRIRELEGGDTRG